MGLPLESRQFWRLVQKLVGRRPGEIPDGFHLLRAIQSPEIHLRRVDARVVHQRLSASIAPGCDSKKATAKARRSACPVAPTPARRATFTTVS